MHFLILQTSMNIKAILFDSDDTLVQTKNVRVKAVIYWAKKFYDLDYTAEQILAYWGLTFTGFISALVQGKDSFEKASANYYKILPEFPAQQYPGTTKALKELAQKYSLGILSSSSHALILSDMKSAGIPVQVFDYIQGEEDSLFHKPDPRVFESAIEFFKHQGINVAEVLYVGDAMHDYSSSKVAGLNFVGLLDRTVTAKAWQEAGANYVKEIGDIAEFLKNN
jgi:HAD superfamily hydrolase (TIGR01549 family)